MTPFHHKSKLSPCHVSPGPRIVPAAVLIRGVGVGICVGGAVAVAVGVGICVGNAVVVAIGVPVGVRLTSGTVVAAGVTVVEADVLGGLTATVATTLGWSAEVPPHPAMNKETRVIPDRNHGMLQAFIESEGESADR